MTDTKHETQPPRYRLAVAFLLGINLILLALVTQMMLSLHKDVTSLKDELATKDELANLASCLGPSDPAMAKLEGTCTSCHTKETFAEAHGYDIDVHQLVTRMSQLSGANIANDQTQPSRQLSHS